MQTVKFEAFNVIGITLRTTNENMKAAQDIPALWNQFMSENTANQIPDKAEEAIYAIYTNYEGDHNKPYDVILGCKVNSLENVPEGMVGHIVEGGSYKEYTAKGDLTQGAVVNTWYEIWKEPSDRTYSSDFEVYGEKAQNPSNAEVPIFIAVNE